MMHCGLLPERQWANKRKTKKKKTGARGLRSIIEKATLDLMYEIPSEENIVSCVITKDVIENGAAPIVTYSDDALDQPVPLKKKHTEKKADETA